MSGIARIDWKRRLWCIEFEEATFRVRPCNTPALLDLLCWSCAHQENGYSLGSGARCQRCGADLGALWAPP